MGVVPRRVILEECVMQKGKVATAGSKMLQNFVAPFDAEIVARLLASEYEIIGRSEMAEFAFESMFSSGAETLSTAVEFVANGEAEFAICNDIFGKQRQQAAENGLCYIRPSYGTVSRHGLIQSVCSMDQLGIVCKDLTEGFELLSIIAGRDSKDGAMHPEEQYNYSAHSKKMRIGVPWLGSNESGSEFELVAMDLQHYEVYKQIFYILACAELANNINRYDGVKFGYRAPEHRGINELYVKSRTQAFGLDVKLAAIMGSYVLSRDQYTPLYEKAMKLRRVIKESLRFDKYDVILLPASYCDELDNNLALYALAPLAGLPSISFDGGDIGSRLINRLFPNAGAGMQLLANVCCENDLLTAWKAVQLCNMK